MDPDITQESKFYYLFKEPGLPEKISYFLEKEIYKMSLRYLLE
jgi:hypothetical protein